MVDVIENGLADELTADEQALFDGSADGGEGGDGGTPPPDETPPVETPAVVESLPDEGASEDDEDADDVVENMPGNPGKFIRHGAFNKERIMRKEAQKQLIDRDAAIAKFREDNARVNERLSLLMQAAQQPAAAATQPDAPAAIPDPETDPFGFMRYLQSENERLKGAVTASHETTQADRAYNDVKGAFASEAKAYVATTPDFYTAYNYLMQARDAELEAIGHDDPKERAKIIVQEEMQIVSDAMRKNKSPSELIYKLAKGRGYSTPAPALAAAVPASAARPTAAEQVAAAKKGQGASKSLGSAAGGGMPQLTADSLANMSEEEFSEVYAKLKPSERRAMFGG